MRIRARTLFLLGSGGSGLLLLHEGAVTSGATRHACGVDEMAGRNIRERFEHGFIGRVGGEALLREREVADNVADPAEELLRGGVVANSGAFIG